MTQSELIRKSIVELAELIKDKKISPLEVTRATLEQIELTDKKLNSYITVMAEAATKAAQQAEKEIKKGNYMGPLQGIPISLKDLYATKGVRTTAGSKILADFIPKNDCTVAERLKSAGAIIIGKTNMHEFAMGVTNENPHYGPCRNPWDLERIPGGSSGGSAAAVAAGLCAGSMGSDTGGSIRIPSALCNIVGLKPSYGRVSRAGVMPLAWSMDHTGPMTRTVEDAALMLQVVAGWDPKDPASAKIPVPNYRHGLKSGVKRLRAGIFREGFFKSPDTEVNQAFNKAVAVLKGLGAVTSKASIDDIEYAPTTLRTIVSGESNSVHEKWLNSRPDDFGADVRSRLEVSRLLLAGDYLRAQRVRNLIRNNFLKALNNVDVLLMPTCPITAPRIGERAVKLGDKVLDVMSGVGRHCSPINLAGLPAITIPCGFSKSGLPIGLQIVGKPFAEGTVLRVGWAYEANTDWHLRWPPIG